MFRKWISGFLRKKLESVRVVPESVKVLIADGSHGLMNKRSERTFNVTVHELKPGKVLTIGRNGVGGVRTNDRDIPYIRTISSKQYDLKNTGGTVVLRIHNTRTATLVDGQKAENNELHLKPNNTAHTEYAGGELKFSYVYIHVPTAEDLQKIEEVEKARLSEEERQERLDRMLKEIAIKKGILGNEFLK